VMTASPRRPVDALRSAAACIPARSRDGIPSRAHRAREHLSQRRDPRDVAPRGCAHFDAIVEFAEIGRFLDTPCEALLQRHVRSPRLCRRRPSPDRHPPRRRGAGGR
jgi:hypothetical protein